MPNYSLSKIYQIVNTQNDLIYIGSTCQTRLSTRFGSHKRDALRRDTPFYNDMKAFGFDNFRILLIKSFSCSSKQELEAEEYATIQQLIKDGKQLYNIKVLQNNQAESTKQKISAANMGHVTSEETKKKLSDANLGKLQSKETKLKMSVATTGDKNSQFNSGCIFRRVIDEKSIDGWTFKWHENKKTKSKTFAVKKYGEHQAYLLCCDYRKYIYPSWRTEEELAIDELANLCDL